MTLLGATTPGQCGPRGDANEEVLHILQSSSITGASPSACLVSYTGHSFGGESYPSAEMQTVYCTAPPFVNLAVEFGCYLGMKNFDRKITVNEEEKERKSMNFN